MREELTEEQERLRKLRAMRPRRKRSWADLVHFLRKTFHPRQLFSADIMRVLSEEEAKEADISHMGVGREASVTSADYDAKAHAEETKQEQARAVLGSANPHLL